MGARPRRNEAQHLAAWERCHTTATSWGSGSAGLMHFEGLVAEHRGDGLILMPETMA